MRENSILNSTTHRDRVGSDFRVAVWKMKFDVKFVNNYKTLTK